jgi:hypothetical protein
MSQVGAPCQEIAPCIIRCLHVPPPEHRQHCTELHGIRNRVASALHGSRLLLCCCCSAFVPALPPSHVWRGLAGCRGG